MPSSNKKKCTQCWAKSHRYIWVGESTMSFTNKSIIIVKWFQITFMFLIYNSLTEILSNHHHLRPSVPEFSLLPERCSDSKPLEGAAAPKSTTTFGFARNLDL